MDIIDLEKVRLRRAFLKLVGNRPGFPCELDCTRTEIMCSGAAYGSGNNFHISVMVYDIGTNPSQPLAVLRFKPDQWLEFKKMGDALFTAHMQIAEKKS